MKQRALPLTSTEPGAPDTDLQPLIQLVGRASVVGLGEATHGTHEFFAMKERLAEFLVEKMGFRVFALENSWDSSLLLDEYVLTGVGDPRVLLFEDMLPTWQRREFLDLLEWMRAYNADPAHLTKVHFAGFDCQTINPLSFTHVVAYVHAVDPARTFLVEALYSGLSHYGGAVDSRKAGQAAFERYRDNAQRAYELLKSHQSEYVTRSSQQAFDLALQTSRVIAQYATIQAMGNSYDNTTAYSLRDVYMAENAIWLAGHEGAQAKLIISAHNAHIANDPAYSLGIPKQKSMGAYLHERFQAAYLPIGMSFYQGSFRAFSDNQLTTFTVGTPSETSSNYAFGNIGIAEYLLDLRNPPEGDVKNWITISRPFRFIGVNYDPATDADFYYTGSLGQWFDLVIHFQNTSPAQLVT